MFRRTLLIVLLFLFCILFTITNSKSQCSCSCCKGNRCIKRYQGSVSLPTCSAKTCKHACKIRYPGQCSGSPGSLLATCIKSKSPARSSLVQRMKSKVKPSSKTHSYRRPY
ncbi:unnamed protein product [Rotaria socialis]|uniref:Uncharacterized protein n=1 Tax=Rotaria socialis TaxID=392032 RepID=A0A817Y4T7_9BILA|nr:unnamed protein product [Rotaria socialis]CAF3370963.1 unnamed protein product [Rotaria socialis]CAF3376997.1 unnamed protein product [Rotaria socialis]CAF3460271.1 unnamed protein product [Rotaria socialis]CAF3584459.1 unnamed protein product [Rotaria socialis]